MTLRFPAFPAGFDSRQRVPELRRLTVNRAGCHDGVNPLASATLLAQDRPGALATVVGGAIVAQFGFPALFTLMSALAIVSFFGVYLQPKRVWRYL